MLGPRSIAQLVECLPTCTKPWVQFSGSYKPSMGVLACNPMTLEVESGGSGVQGHPQLHEEIEASLGYMSPCLKSKK